ncbi:hypothetical protein V2J09_018294 [Rumex salicifolius]
MVTMIVGEVANFVAYVYAFAVLMTPLGAMSIIISYFGTFPAERKIVTARCHGLCVMHSWLCSDCSLCASRTISELCPRSLGSCNKTSSNINFALLATLWTLKCACLLGNLVLDRFINSISVDFSFSLVVSIKAIGIAIKLTLEGTNQFVYPQTWFFLTIAAICVVTQLNYLNKALDTFNAAIVSPIYYVVFTTLTIAANAIMFKVFRHFLIASELCGFINVLSGSIILHATRDLVVHRHFLIGSLIFPCFFNCKPNS